MKNIGFNFYDNTLALSFEKSKRGIRTEELKSDFTMYGNPDHLANGLIEQMERHPELAEVVTIAAYNYLQRNGKP